MVVDLLIERIRPLQENHFCANPDKRAIASTAHVGYD